MVTNVGLAASGEKTYVSLEEDVFVDEGDVFVGEDEDPAFSFDVEEPSDFDAVLVDEAAFESVA
jgi:hypothetical protein